MPLTADKILARDLECVAREIGDGWQALDGARIFMTGGTGFIGRWILEAMRHAQQKLGVKFDVIILTRDTAAFKAGAGGLADFDRFSFIRGNVIDFDSPTQRFTHIIHAAADASAQLNAENPRLMFDVIVQGTRRVLDLALQSEGARVLNLSSGAVYGRQPAEISHVAENWLGAPDCRAPVNAYAEAKRAAEMLCAIYGHQSGVDVITARIFAAIGPFLPLGKHFAIGNFILDAMQGRPVIVQSDGRAERSYLYAADLTVWLLRLLTGGNGGAVYNVGSQHAVSIGDLAKLTASLIGLGHFQIAGCRDAGWNPGRYVPSTASIEKDLHVHESVSLEEAILRTAQWHGWKRQNP